MADDSGRAVFSTRTIAGSWMPSGFARVPKNEIAWVTESRDEGSESAELRGGQPTLVQDTLELKGFQVHEIVTDEDEGQRRQIHVGG